MKTIKQLLVKINADLKRIKLEHENETSIGLRDMYARSYDMLKDFKEYIKEVSND